MAKFSISSGSYRIAHGQYVVWNGDWSDRLGVVGHQSSDVAACLDGSGRLDWLIPVGHARKKMDFASDGRRWTKTALMRC